MTDLREKLWEIAWEIERLPVWRDIAGTVAWLLLVNRTEDELRFAIKHVLPDVYERLAGIYAYYTKHFDELDEIMRCRVEDIRVVAEEIRQIIREVCTGTA